MGQGCLKNMSTQLIVTLMIIPLLGLAARLPPTGHNKCIGLCLSPSVLNDNSLHCVQKRSAMHPGDETNKETHVTAPPADDDVAAGGHAFVHLEKHLNKSVDFEEISNALKQREQAPSDKSDRIKRQKFLSSGYQQVSMSELICLFFK